MTKRLSPILVACCLMLLFTSCDRKRNDKGYEYFPDMAHSLAYETYAPNLNLSAGQSMLLPAPNTIPMEMMPYAYDATIKSRELAARELTNQVTLNEEALIRGKEQFIVFCAQCNGVSGNGDGFLYTSGKYNFKPASLLSDKMMASNDADIFHVITAGYQVMGAHGHMIRPDDRWKIALYVKHELQKQ